MLANEPRKAMANQIMTAAKQRLARRIATLDRADLLKVETAILVQLGLNGRIDQNRR